MSRIIALVIVLAGLAGGLALGVALRPDGGVEAAAGADAEAAGPSAGADAAGSAAPDTEVAGRAYVKLARQIVIPVVRDRRTEALMLFELALDVPSGMTERAYAIEPRLRDAFLRVLLEMSYTGAFSRDYTDERVLRELRDKLRHAAGRLLDAEVFDVLILDMLRQEI